jgi:aspartate racemase
MSAHIGIVACSAEGAALCYRTICQEAPARMGRYGHPEISIHAHPLSRYMEGIERDDWQAVGALMLSAAQKLAGCGADFLICPDNTIHRAFETVAKHSPLPWLHIVEEVAAEARRCGFQRLALLGTKYTMEGPVYPAILGRRGLEQRIPSSRERAEIDRIIFEELVNGIVRAESLQVCRAVIERLQAGGCDAAVLGCTELPLLLQPADSSLPILDTTRILARAALRRALEHADPAPGAARNE